MSTDFATAQSAQYCLSSACSTALSAREGKLCVYRLIGQKDIFPPLLSRLLPFFFFLVLDTEGTHKREFGLSLS